MKHRPPCEETILCAAKELRTPEERATYLREACGADEQLRQRVAAMLAATEVGGGFPAEPQPHIPPQPQPTPLLSPASEKPGDRIGRYKLLQEIGQGGGGVVYMAEQEEPIRRRVALKVIKLGMDTRQVIARFEAERQALTLMDHPHIARVLDAGATDAGRPYFVMELVRGIGITRFCDENNLRTEERLKLFVQICHAIQHAHQKGIIHRDIKPANVLVAQLDGGPVPKVIDFGIAKAIHQPLTDKTLVTSFGQFIGTPAYVSPEQAEMSAADVDTRSDIYALGVLLYELLTGYTPFEPKELLETGFDEMRRLIREKEPPRPSTRLRLLSASDLRTVAQHRRVEPPRLIHAIRGDLDWIVMKCLEKNRARRYASADALAEDVERHQKDEPVTAAAPSAFYRTAKFVRRYRRGVTAAVVLMLVLAAGFVWQTVEIRRTEQETRLVTEFLGKALKDVRVSMLKGRDTTLLRELLDKASNRLPQELPDQPETQAHMRLAMGFLYQELKVYTKAQAAFLQARETYRALHGQENAGVAACTFGLALVSLKQGDYPEAEAKARSAAATGRRVFGSDDTVLAHTLNCLAAALLAQHATNQFEEAAAACREAISIAEKHPGEEELLLANSLSILGQVLRQQEKPANAVPILRQALDLRERLLGKTNAEVAEVSNQLYQAAAEASRSTETPILKGKTNAPAK